MWRFKGWFLLSILIQSLYFQSVDSLSRGKHVLAVLDSIDLKTSHSKFFDDLKAQGLIVAFRQSSDKEVKLKDQGEWLFDHLILFTPKSPKFSAAFGTKSVLDFIDGGGNVVIVGGKNLSPKMIELAGECGVDFDEQKSQVLDHFSFAQGVDKEEGKSLPKTDQSLIATEFVTPLRSIAGATPYSAPILFRGVAHSIPPGSEMVTVGLTGGHTAYSAVPGTDVQSDSDLIAGRDTYLASFVEGNNNARVGVFGSLDMFSNEFFDAEFRVYGADGKVHGSSGNRQFCLNSVLFTFQERGVLIASEPRHWEVPSGVSKEMYRINDDMHFEIDIMEVENGKKLPFKASDMQLEYVMLDPHVRQTLKTDGNGTFYADFKAPDVYGVFKFVIDYKPAGFSHLDVVQQVPLRPFRHNEFERFLWCAYPYYVSVLSSMVGFFLLGFMFLYHK